jgi:hypothetical protein
MIVHRFIHFWAFRIVPVRHDGACGFETMAVFEKAEGDLAEFVIRIAEFMTSNPAGTESERQFGLELIDFITLDRDGFNRHPKLPSKFWCNAMCLEAYAQLFKTIVMTFGYCFEREGYMLKAVYDFDNGDEERFIKPYIVAIHHEGVAFSPLIDQDIYTNNT